MVEVIRSMTRLSWSMALFGARQIGGLLAADTDRVTAGFDVLTGAGRRELDGALERVLEAGEKVQVTAADRLFGLLAPGGGDSVNQALAMLEHSAATLRAFPGQTLSGQELVNKVRAVRDFRNADSCVGRDTAEASWTDRLEWARGLGAYRALWAMEGLGFALAENAGDAPVTLSRRADLPHAARVPLHTGFGLSLAMRALGPIDRWSEDSTLRSSVEAFADQCATLSAPGHSMMAFEALGFVVRSLYPGLLLRVDRILSALDPELVGYYWHGVGRGLYFLPSQLPLVSDAWGRALDKATSEPPHEEGRRNALAGFAWALTLVNIEHPEVLARFVKERLGVLRDPSALSHGVSSALVIWSSANGRDAILRGMLAHRPDPTLAQPWLALVSLPGEAAVRHMLDSNVESELETIFRFQTESELEALGSVGNGYSQCTPWAISAAVRSFDGWMGRAFQTLSRPPRARSQDPFDPRRLEPDEGIQ